MSDKSLTGTPVQAGSFSTRYLVMTALFTALTAVLSQFSIPMPAGVPMTLQTLIIPIAGIILGWKYGTLSTLLYLLLGAVGLPVFANMSGGLSVFVGPTAGFLISFPLLSLLAGLFTSRSSSGLSAYLGLVLGSLLNYTVGILVFMVVTGSGLKAALLACFLPFLPTAIIKILLSKFLGLRLRRALQGAHLL